MIMGPKPICRHPLDLTVTITLITFPHKIWTVTLPRLAEHECERTETNGYNARPSFLTSVCEV